jgi:hypothetical protein
MQFIAGDAQQAHVQRTTGLDPSRCLAARIDVEKYQALSLIADYHAEIVGEPLMFRSLSRQYRPWRPCWSQRLLPAGRA